MQPIFCWQSFVIGVTGAIAINSINGGISSVQAAQTVIIHRGSLTRSIKLADLKTLDETGTVPPRLQDAARILTPQQRSQIEAALKAKFNINAVAASNFLSTEFGNNLSSALATVTPRRDRVGVQAGANSTNFGS
jgi:hypothetical protein